MLVCDGMYDTLFRGVLLYFTFVKLPLNETMKPRVKLYLLHEYVDHTTFERQFYYAYTYTEKVSFINGMSDI